MTFRPQNPHCARCGKSWIARIDRWTQNCSCMFAHGDDFVILPSGKSESYPCRIPRVKAVPVFEHYDIEVSKRLGVRMVMDCGLTPNRLREIFPAPKG